jgi:ribosome-associated heat shock protein Hsp15
LHSAADAARVYTVRGVAFGRRPKIKTTRHALDAEKEPVTAAPGTLRIDKWLWAARFFKTRSLAATAVSRGRVRVNGDAAKPARTLKAGDTLEIRRDRDVIEVIVMMVSAVREPASKAAILYRESQSSIDRRALEHEARALLPARAPAPPKRPDKKARRELQRFRRGDRAT